MIGIFILIGAYRYYAGLAERFGKTKWHYGLLAIGVYLGFQIAFFLAYGFYQGLTNTYDERDYTGFSLINIIAWILAIAAVYGVYKLLENKFRKERVIKPSAEIEEIGRKD